MNVNNAKFKCIFKNQVALQIVHKETNVFHMFMRCQGQTVCLVRNTDGKHNFCLLTRKPCSAPLSSDQCISTSDPHVDAAH